MKTLLNIAIGLMILLNSVIARAVSPSQPHVTVQVTIQNKSSVASLKFWDFSYAQSFPSMSAYIPPLFPVNPNSSGSLSIKIPTKPTIIPASLSYGYDHYNNCVFLLSYSNNKPTVTFTSHGGVSCTQNVSGKSVILTINQSGQQKRQSITITSQIQFTIVNDSSIPLTHYKLRTVSPSWLGPVSISPTLATIPANSPLSFTATINHSLPKGASVHIDYGFNGKNFCRFSLPISELGTQATVIKTISLTKTKKMICTVGNDNSLHVNIYAVLLLCP